MLIPADRITLRSWLAWYHMLAGAAGMLVVLFVAPSSIGEAPVASRPAMGLLFLTMLGLFSVVAWAGVLLSMSSPWGPTVATVVQALQIPTARIAGFVWIFFGGGYLVPYWQLGKGPGAILGVKANLDFYWGGEANALVIGVNLVPLLILWLLRRKLPSTEASAALPAYEPTGLSSSASS